MIVLCIIIFAVIVSFLNGLYCIKYGMWLYEVDDFSDVKPSMKRMIKDYYSYYENTEDKENFISVTISNHGGENCTVRYYYEDESKNKKEEYKLTPRQKEDFDIVNDAFFGEDTYFNNMCITENEIYFFSIRPYYIVYTLDQMYPEVPPDWFCERLSFGWYQCVEIPELYRD